MVEFQSQFWHRSVRLFFFCCLNKTKIVLLKILLPNIAIADIFHSVDFDPPYRRATLAADGEYDRPPAALPNFEVPGVRAPAIGYNWQSYMLARNNFPLFIRYLQRAAKETSWRAARRANRAYDPRAVDFRKLLNGWPTFYAFANFSFIAGFSLIDYEPSIVHEARVYVLRRVRSIQQQTAGLFDARDRRLPTWTEFMKPEDVELHNMTWNGVVSGRVRVVERPAEFPFTKLERAALFACKSAVCRARLFVAAAVCSAGDGCAHRRFRCLSMRAKLRPQKNDAHRKRNRRPRHCSRPDGGGARLLAVCARSPRPRRRARRRLHRAGDCRSSVVASRRARFFSGRFERVCIRCTDHNRKLERAA